MGQPISWRLGFLWRARKAPRVRERLVVRVLCVSFRLVAHCLTWNAPEWWPVASPRMLPAGVRRRQA